MAKPKYDLRTEREKRRDNEAEVIAKRFKELLPYAPSITRAITTIAGELGVHPTCVRSRLIKMGIYTPGNIKGRGGNFTVNL